MKTSKQGIDYIIAEEGKINYEYYCPANVPTIGVGCVTRYIPYSTRKNFKKVPLSEVRLVGNIKPVVDDASLVMTIDDNQMMDLFISRLAEFEEAVNNNIKMKLVQHQFDALVSFCFNVGVSNFTRSTLCKSLNENSKIVDISKWFAAWNKSKGKILPVLVKRREREINLFLYAKY